jgi:hypothetical protein
MRQSVPSQVRELPRAAEAGSPPTGLLVLGCPPAASEDLTPRRHPTCVRGMNKGMVTPGTFRFLIIGNLFKASGAPRLRQKPCLPPALTAVCPLSPGHFHRAALSTPAQASGGHLGVAGLFHSGQECSNPMLASPVQQSGVCTWVHCAEEWQAIEHVSQSLCASGRFPSTNICPHKPATFPGHSSRPASLCSFPPRVWAGAWQAAARCPHVTSPWSAGSWYPSC